MKLITLYLPEAWLQKIDEHIEGKEKRAFWIRDAIRDRMLADGLLGEDD